MKQNLIVFITKKYTTRPEYLWERYPSYCVFRHLNNRKWFAIIMSVPQKNLGLPGNKNVDIINVKCEPDSVGFLRDVPGILPAYHMNKINWVSILLDGTVPLKNIKNLIEASFDLTK